MSAIKSFLKKLYPVKNSKQNITSIQEVLPQLSHDLNNYFIAIRAVCGSIKKNIKQSEKNDLQKSVSSIEKMVNHASALMTITQTLSSPLEQYAADISSFSVLDCLQQVIANYPFPAEKFVAAIRISAPAHDFIIIGSKHLMTHIFYCLIKNTLHAIYTLGSGEAVISLTSQEQVNLIHVQVPQASQTPAGIFSLGSTENPGHGLLFIQRAIDCMRGKMIVEDYNNHCFTASFLFSHAFESS